MATGTIVLSPGAKFGTTVVVPAANVVGLRLMVPAEPAAVATTRPRQVNSICDTVPSPAAAATLIVAGDETSVRLPPLKLIYRP